MRLFKYGHAVIVKKNLVAHELVVSLYLVSLFHY